MFAALTVKNLAETTALARECPGAFGEFGGFRIGNADGLECVAVGPCKAPSQRRRLL